MIWKAKGPSPSPHGSVEEMLTALQFSEVRYRRLFEAARDGILLLNAKTAVIEDANPYLVELLGYSHDELLGKKLWEIGSFSDTKINKAIFKELQDSRYIRYENLPLETKGGRLISVDFVSNVYDCNGLDIIQCNIRDNTKRHIAEVALEATTRALKILSESNTALLKNKTEQLLLEEYCRIAVDTGGYKMAWIGYALDNPEKSIMIMAYYGDYNDSIVNRKRTWAEEPSGNDPVGRAFRTKEIQVCYDVLSDASMKEWHTEALTGHYRSLIVLPFQLDHGLTGSLTLHGATVHSWSLPEQKLLQEVSEDLSYGIKALRTAAEIARHQEELLNSLEQTIQVIAETISQHDPYTAGHQKRVAVLASEIAREIGLSKDRTHGLHLAATIHDLGKIGIPADILVKSSSLSDMEYQLVKNHVDIGYNIIKKVSFPWPISEILLQHHERLDGSGYPYGLKKDDILLESKILAVADVVEAMASHRPYRPALGIEAALQEIVKNSGIYFDSVVVETCVGLFRKKGFQLPD